MCRSLLPLLLPTVLAAAVSALPPPREITTRRYNTGSVSHMGNAGYHSTGQVQRQHPMRQATSRHPSVEDNFYSSSQADAHYLSEDASRSSFGISDHRAPLYDHEKILSSSSEAQEPREVVPLRNTGESQFRRTDSLSRTTPVHNDPSIHNSENRRLPNQNHRTDNQPSFPETVGRRDTGDIVFPEGTNFMPKEDIKNCSQDWSNVCVSNVRDYPYQHIEQVLTNSAYDFRSFFTDDYVDLKTRIDVDGNDDSVCDSDETILYPKLGQTANDQVLFIVNNDGNYKQGVRVEKCRRKDQSPCDSKIVVPTGYKTYCKQKYIYRKLLALQPNGDPVPDNFRLPSCCSCYIAKDLASFRSLIKPKD